MLNLREAGSTGVVLSKGSKSGLAHVQSQGLGTWRAATRPDMSALSSSDAYPDTATDVQSKAHGVASFIGFEEFEFALGGNSDSGQSSSRD